MGVFELLGLDINFRSARSETITLSKLESGLHHDGKKLHSLQSRFSNIVAGIVHQPTLFEGLAEAADNALSHAYPAAYKPTYPFAGHRWWGASCYDINRDCLRFFIFDQGAGIPHTLPRSGLWEQIRASVDDISGGLISDDGFVLQKAFEVGRTQTRMSHRGLGLGGMREVIEAGPGCRFRVISGRGEVNQENGALIENLTHSRHIGGTLVEWSIPAGVISAIAEELRDE